MVAAYGLKINAVALEAAAASENRGAAFYLLRHRHRLAARAWASSTRGGNGVRSCVPRCRHPRHESA